jgi:hypothetical protein
MNETVHAVDHTGYFCERCGAVVAEPPKGYAPGARVVVPDGDARGSWRVLRRVSCERRVA